MTISRRRLMQGAGAGTALGFLAPRFAFANADTDRRFLFVFLRGGMDGMTVLPAYGEPKFREMRGDLADGMPGEGTRWDMLKLDGMFAVNPDLPVLQRLYQAGDLLAVHATCHGYRDRSHFDAQDAFDRGSVDKGVRGGWINRALAAMPAAWSTGRDNLAMGLGPTLPLSLRGTAAVGSWSPPITMQASPDTIGTLAKLFMQDPELGPQLEKGLAAQEMGKGGNTSGGSFTRYTRAAAKFLNEDKGPRLMTIDLGNWDTHSDQNNRSVPSEQNGFYAGRFANMYIELNAGLEALHKELRPEVWKKTVVMMVTEFGRTVRINGTRGTDHGTGGAAFLLGGAVQGGRVVADWPGIGPNDLLDGRDLRPTTDSRALAKAVLREHLGIADADIESTVFPESRDVRPLEGLIRT